VDIGVGNILFISHGVSLGVSSVSGVSLGVSVSLDVSKCRLIEGLVVFLIVTRVFPSLCVITIMNIAF
jgi:hypothetical protein